MGGMAAKMADRVIVTSDNSRTENTLDIIEDIKAGIKDEDRRKVLTLSDRKEAIRMAVLTAKPDSTILLAGKGHEDYQIIGKEKHHFDEREIVREILDELKD